MAFQAIKQFKAKLNLMSFTLFLDDDGIFKVGVRLNKALITYSANYPLVLHSRSKTTRVLVEKAHHDR